MTSYDAFFATIWDAFYKTGNVPLEFAIHKDNLLQAHADAGEHDKINDTFCAFEDAWEAYRNNRLGHNYPLNPTCLTNYVENSMGWTVIRHNPSLRECGFIPSRGRTAHKMCCVLNENRTGLCDKHEKKVLGY